MIIKSIRASIFLYLGICLLITTLWVSFSTHYFFNRQDIRQHLDAMLAMTALSISAGIESNSPEELQKMIDLPSQFQSIHTSHLKIPAYQIQIYDQQGKALTHSKNVHHWQSTLHLKPGFQTKHPWRIFITYNPKNKDYILVAQALHARKAIIQSIILKDLSFLLFVLPVMGLFIWILINKGLQPLNQVISQVRKRHPEHLQPLKVSHTPKEIQPLIIEINQLLQRLKEGLSREQHFAADAAHEIRTPLAIIKTLAQTAINSKNPKDIEFALKKIIDSVDRATHVMIQLMNMSKTMTDMNKKSNFQAINLAKLASECLSELVPQALEKNIELDFESENNCPNIQGNPIALNILIRNLVDNAIRYSPKETHIYIKIYSTEESVVLEVRDEGPGIPKAKKDKVFERFYRAQNQHAPQGTGLGLSIVKQIAELHDAQWSLEEPLSGTGVVFRVFIPLKKSIISPRE